MVETEDFQWIWAVLSGFPRHISLAQVLEYGLPYADMYPGFWANPVSIQHPLAEVEIVSWDSSCTLVISRNHKIVSDFMDGFPLSRDLSLYNGQNGILDETDELEHWLLQHR